MSARPDVQPLEASPAADSRTERRRPSARRRSSASVLAESDLLVEALEHVHSGHGVPTLRSSQARVHADDRPAEGPGRRGSVKPSKPQAWHQPELSSLASQASADDLSDEEDSGHGRLTPAALYNEMLVADEHLPELPGWWFERFSLMTQALDLSGAAVQGHGSPESKTAQPDDGT